MQNWLFPQLSTMFLVQEVGVQCKEVGVQCSHNKQMEKYFLPPLESWVGYSGHIGPLLPCIYHSPLCSGGVDCLTSGPIDSARNINKLCCVHCSTHVHIPLIFSFQQLNCAICHSDTSLQFYCFQGRRNSLAVGTHGPTRV